MKIQLYKIVSVALMFCAITLLFPRCAKVVAPTGGPKDTLPPVLIRSTPPINATNFTDNELVFEFDEYFKLNNIRKKMLVSPPLNYRPDIKQKGKKLIVTLSDTLKPNTTYTLYLSDAIADNNEGNPIENFEFAFSTGPSIDTLSLQGKVVDAFTGKPVESALIMLYADNIDSLPYTTRPMHVAKTNKKGTFRINNLKPLTYKLVAITDGNSNYLYSQGREQIAFSDTLISSRFITRFSGKKTKLKLRMFREPLPFQLLLGYSRPERHHIELDFSRKPSEGFSMSPISEPDRTNWYVTEPDPEGDTLHLWITDREIALRDTLKILLSYYKTDSLNVLHPQKDTLKLLYLETNLKFTSRKKKKHEKADTLSAKHKGFALKLSLNDKGIAVPDNPVSLTLPAPAARVDSSMILILNATDSLLEKPITLFRDSINPRIYRFTKAWKPNTTYKMLILPNAFEDITGKTNDTLRLTVTGADPEQYGTLTVKLSGVKNGAVVELIKNKKTVVDSKSIIGNGSVTFTFIKPDDYSLRVIDDTNRNGIWDSGNYLNKRQPERVVKFKGGKKKGIIKIRANWDNEISINLSKH